MTDIELRLLNSFPRSYINMHGEFIAHERSNEYFILRNCENDLDIQCKVLEWLSRGACKTEPYKTRRKNKEFNDFMRKGINEFLGTNFSIDEMLQIYVKLGNACNHSRTVEFIQSGYDFDLLT